MKILFSADWHLGYTLHGANQISRLEDQVRQIRRIAEYIEEHEVDVLAIAGDVFESQDRGPALAAVRRMLATLQGPLARGLKIVAIAGNHDRDYFMETANTWMSVEAGEGGGRLFFRTQPELLPVPVRGETVSFVLLPYPNAVRYAVREEELQGAAQRNQLLAEIFCDRMEQLQRDAAAVGAPAVLMTHVTIEGHTVNAHRLSARDDVTIPRGRFPEFELTVIGHIHKAERLGGGEFYYVGALDRMDAGEKDYQPRVLLADIGPTGLREIRSLPLDPTPIVEVTASTEEELEAARSWMKEPQRTLV
ncbi:MAG: metallophosphoesterase family protein, partial [Dehalococcoidia bacterium]